MNLAIFLFNTSLFALALVNYATMRRPRSIEENISQSVLVLLPARNEEENIERIAMELKAQRGLSKFKVLVIDDSSEDRTFSIAEEFISEDFSLIRAPLPPQGWIGKVNALQAGYLAEKVNLADVVISIDADVHFEPTAMAQAVAVLEKSGLDFISPYPRQIAITWAERLVQPLLQWSWMSTVLLRGAEKFPTRSTVVCNGQFLVMRGAALAEINGFESVAHKVLDDIELGRSFVSSGFKGAVIDGSSVSSTRMYSSFAEICQGYGKSLRVAFGSPIGAIFATLFIGLTGIAPLFGAISGDLISIAALLAIIGTRILSAAASSTRIRDSFLHSLSSAALIYLIYYSWRNRGKVLWKGRAL